MGHCWGASVASIVISQPQAATYQQVDFTQEDIKGLVSELGNTSAISRVLFTCADAIKPYPGQDASDKFAYDFQQALLNNLLISEEGKPLESNLRDPSGLDPSAIWCHAIYKYKSSMQESDEGNENVIVITTTVYANADAYPNNNVIDRTETYVYKLRYDPEGNLDRKFINQGQDWISATGFVPNNLWDILGSNFDGKGRYNNPFVLKNNVERLGVNFP